MEHLCKGCIESLKEEWVYLNDEIEVMIVPIEKCDNTYIGRDIDPYADDFKVKYAKGSVVIKLKKGEVKI